MVSNRSLKEPLQTRPEPQAETRQSDVPPHKQCPLCWGERRGVGICDGTYKKGSSYLKRYYRCNQCAHTWTKEFIPEQVKHIND